jgi:hypothetical protein
VARVKPATAIRLFGEPDDHLRFAVLLAAAAAETDPRVRETDAYRTSTAASSAWRDRESALWALVERGSKPLAQVVDVDALDPGRTTAATFWDDRTFQRERRSLLIQVLSAVEHGRLTVRRTFPSSRRVTDTLTSMGEWTDPADPIAPAVRGVRDWLLHTEKLSAQDLERIVSSLGLEANQHLLAIAYDSLPFKAREVAKRSSILRGAQRLNGVLGPFVVGEDLPRADVDLLTRAAFLVPAGGNMVEMPRPIRSFLQPLAELSSPERVVADHRRLGQEDFTHRPIAEQLEVHHHAVRGGDVDRAKATAKFYGADLRELAFRLSVEQQDYRGAAELYRHIVETIDANDAYAWEYLAYNSALSVGQEGLAAHGPEIRKAYERAFALEPQNPLFHGRLLAFRVRLGEEVISEIHGGMAAYVSATAPDALSFFAEPILKALESSGQDADLERISSRWGQELARFERLQSFCT